MVRCLIALVLLAPVSFQILAQAPDPPAAAVENVPFEKTVRAYRVGPIGENLQIRVKDDRGRERRSDVLVKLDAAGAAGQGPLRARIELGELVVSIEGDRMLAAHRLEKGRYAEFTLAKGPLLESLAAVMPALILPPLALADRSANRIEDLGVLSRPGAVKWDPGVVDRPTGKLLYSGSSGDASFKMLVDRNSGRLASLQVTFNAGPIRNIDLTARSLSPGSPDTWPIEIAGRQRVDALADLTAESDQVRVGERFPPTMTLLTTGLSPWKEVRDDLASVCIFVQIDTSAIDDADGAVRDEAIARLRRDTRIANQLVRKLELGANDRWIARCVAIIPPESLRFEISTILLSMLNPSDSAVLTQRDNLPLIAVAQSFDYDPILGGGQGGVVVLDKSRIVRAIITLGDLESTEKKVREVLDSLK